jgi:FimV-like protein
MIRPSTEAEKQAATLKQSSSPNSQSPPALSPKELAEKRERAAASKLRLAQQFIDRGEKSKARDWLAELIKEYPESDAAKTAQEKLNALK